MLKCSKFNLNMFESVTIKVNHIDIFYFEYNIFARLRGIHIYILSLIFSVKCNKYSHVDTISLLY